jgi:serine/threonine protein kinase
LIRSFLEEAQITGQLDHPGIVPVHELGLDASGRVYFTMKLVRGETSSGVRARARGQEDWNQTRALGVLLRVCEAMAYAHDKGVCTAT